MEKEKLIGLLLLGAAFALFFTMPRPEPPPPQTPSPAEQSPAESGPFSGEAEGPDTSAGSPGSSADSGVVEADRSTVRPPEQTVVLENAFVRVTFTSYGAGVAETTLKEYKATRGGDEPYRLNSQGEIPALSLSLSTPLERRDQLPAYDIARRDAESVTFTRELPGGLRIERTYSITPSAVGATGADPYLIRHSTRLVNEGSQRADPGSVYLSAGTAGPVEGDPTSRYLTFGYYDGGDDHFIPVGKFISSSGVLGFGANPARRAIQEETPVVWASVKNQFFAGILTPSIPADGFITRPVLLDSGQIIDLSRTPAIPGKGAEAVSRFAITGSVRFDLAPIIPGQDYRLDATYYAGPKEYPRIAELGQNQDRVMQFGWFGLFSKLLLHLLLVVESAVQNYGLAIVTVTLFLRLLLWPITGQAAKSSRKMQRIQGPMKEIREKYKDQPEKMQRAQLELFKKHKVNPAAGCLPLLVQMPIFIGFFYMLRSASELRFEPFLWIADLSQPDTIAVIPGIGLPVNPMPILMAASMFVQMQVAAPPTIDSTQRMIFKFMPVMMLFVLYNFSSGLALYWTTSNLFSIFQQVITNRRLEQQGLGHLSPEESGTTGGNPWKPRSSGDERAHPGHKPAARKATPRPAGKGRSSGAADQKKSGAGKRGRSSSSGKRGRGGRG